MFIYSVFSQQGAVDLNYNQPSHICKLYELKQWNSLIKLGTDVISSSSSWSKWNQLHWRNLKHCVMRWCILYIDNHHQVQLTIKLKQWNCLIKLGARGRWGGLIKLWPIYNVSWYWLCTKSAFLTAKLDKKYQNHLIKPKPNWCNHW